MKREVARRIFAEEYNISNHYIKGETKKSPNYLVSPTGAKCNRVFIIGVLTEVEKINEDMIKAKLSDPTGMFTIYAGNYQEKEKDFLIENEPPFFAAVTGKTNVFESDKGNIFTSIRPEKINEVKEDIRDDWLINTAKKTVYRIKKLKEAKKSGFTGEELTEYLKSKNVRKDLVEGIKIALENYEIDFEKYNEIIKEALGAYTTLKKDQKKPKDVVKKIIKRIDEGKGVSYSKVIEKASKRGFEENIIEKAVNDLMEEGKCYEPEIGKLKLV